MELTYEQVKAAGAPFQTAEVQVSLRSKVARLVLVASETSCPTMDFPLQFPSEEDFTDYEDAGLHVIEAARLTGLLRKNSAVAIIDLDSMPVQA